MSRRRLMPLTTSPRLGANAVVHLYPPLGLAQHSSTAAPVSAWPLMGYPPAQLKLIMQSASLKPSQFHRCPFSSFRGAHDNLRHLCDAPFWLYHGGPCPEWKPCSRLCRRGTAWN